MKLLRMLMVAGLLLPAMSMLAQPVNAIVKNNTGCDMEVTLYSQDTGPCTEYTAVVTCIAPGGVAVIAAPGPASAQWSLMEALPWEPYSGCSATCPPGIVNVSSPIGCGGAGSPVTVQEDCGCNNGYFTANWVTASQAELN